jgi:hypothetical protein
MKLAITWLTLSTITYAFPSYVSLIPNGKNVPDVAAVGHVDTTGGGTINPFGIAFDQAGKKWTKELCEQDSDDDGATNGEELGDPCCVWVPGAPHFLAVTSPGHKNIHSMLQLAEMKCPNSSYNPSRNDSSKPVSGMASTPSLSDEDPHSHILSSTDVNDPAYAASSSSSSFSLPSSSSPSSSSSSSHEKPHDIMDKCRPVSVVGDATYCVTGVMCSGAGASPDGTKCPVKGDIAEEDCHPGLQSYQSPHTCVAPVNAACKQLQHGAWGCVWT